MTVLALLAAGERLELSREQALALADRLWQGQRRGALTSAGKLAQVLRSDSAPWSRFVEFTGPEMEAVYEALAAIGITDGAPAARALRVVRER